tara:strand:- start:4825 stop:6018 length:1194 start_codon:yes stop_codon:yes gene_type:complete
MKALIFASVALFALGSIQAAEVNITPILTDHSFERPVSLMIPPDGSKRQFLVEQTGKIKILGENGESRVFLDFSDRAMAERDFEEGLLGLAFHPNYAENRKFYVYYSQQGPKRSVISEIQASKDDPGLADLSTERILLEIQQPEWNHNSGNLFFGPNDGLLYICVGDGGMKNGVFMLAQKLTRWNGKVLRIDVDGSSGHRPYGIPADNPFIDTPNACPEIYAYGFRNPWGASIDPETGLFWLADVGQNLWEEVNLVEKGGNYGWEYREGLHQFYERDKMMDALGIGAKQRAPKAGTTFVDPIWEYDRTQGLSITGGFVYRGEKIPALKGCFIVGDWKLGNTWALKYDQAAGKVAEAIELYRPTQEDKFQPTAFCPDLDGEIIVLNWDGRIFRIDPAG